MPIRKNGEVFKVNRKQRELSQRWQEEYITKDNEKKNETP